jgi:alpha/beta hydrolase family protein
MLRLVIIALLSVGILCGCGESPSASSSGRSAKSSSAVTVITPTERLVDVGGYHLLLDCRGHGSPTVVFENGFAALGRAWSNVRSAMRGAQRVCSYDRAGTGGSDSRPAGRASARTMAGDLARLLDRAGERPPYILVGWSFGGLVARAFRDLRPAQVEGMVLVEAASEHQYVGVPDTLEGDTTVDLRASGKQAAAAAPLEDLPLVVLTAGTQRELPKPWRARWTRWQDELAKLSTDSIHVIAKHSGHDIPDYQAELVVQAIRDLTSAADGSRLTPCDRRYRALGGACADS